MSTYGVTGSGSLLPDLPNDPEILFTNFLKDNWNDTIAGVKKENIGFGYEPEQDSNKPFIIKVEENFTNIDGIHLGNSVNRYDGTYDCIIWSHDGKKYTNISPTTDYRFLMRKYVERFIIQNQRGGISIGGNRYIKHLIPITSRNQPEPERMDWHRATVTFQMLTFKATTI